jgi:hypothetical protein
VIMKGSVKNNHFIQKLMAQAVTPFERERINTLHRITLPR